MSLLVWDKLSERIYETGLDRGVLYLPDGSAVPWNGLTEIIEKPNKEVSSIYYDGMKINDVVVLGEFQAIMKAITYPDEFVEIEGAVSLTDGVFLSDQRPQTFGLSYRTKIGNPIDGDSAGYKLHIIYNITAIPSDKSYSSITDSPSFSEFEWNITAVPEDFPGFRPSAHIIVDSRKVDPWLLEDIEKILYGTSSLNADLIPLPDLVDLLNNWHRIRIINNGNGTWTAISARDGFISVDPITGIFTIVDVNAVYLDSDTYAISDTD